MNNKDFKDIFNTICKEKGYERTFSGWWKESEECIVVLDLQKSNYGNTYHLNIKCFIQGLFGKSYNRNKDLVRKSPGDVFTRLPAEYDEVLDLDNTKPKQERLREAFDGYLNYLVDKLLSRSGVKELHEKEEIFLLPAVKEQLYYVSRIS